MGNQGCHAEIMGKMGGSYGKIGKDMEFLVYLYDFICIYMILYDFIGFYMIL